MSSDLGVPRLDSVRQFCMTLCQPPHFVKSMVSRIFVVEKLCSACADVSEGLPPDRRLHCAQGLPAHALPHRRHHAGPQFCMPRAVPCFRPFPCVPVDMAAVPSQPCLAQHNCAWSSDSRDYQAPLQPRALSSPLRSR